MICLDTMVLIWGVQGVARPGQEPMVERTRRYLTALREENEQIMVPTPAVAEYLQHFDTEERRRQLEILSRSFFLPAFDVPAAYLAAGLSHRMDSERPASISRQAVKTDVQILATAIVHQAERIITNDHGHYEKLAVGQRIVVSEVPEIHEQTHLDLDV